MAAREPRSDMAGIYTRVRERRQDYIEYDFTRKKNDILKTFFDLTQEYATLRDLYRICVAVPYEFLKLESRLYLINEFTQELELVCDSKKGLIEPRKAAAGHIFLSEEPYEQADSYVMPIMRRQYRDREFAVLRLSSPFMGMFELYPAARLTPEDRFFFRKYTNRIGYNIYNRIIDRQNIRHLKFINSLVLDIEHNVIVPNMYFKYLFRQLRSKIEELGQLKVTIQDYMATPAQPPDACHRVYSAISLLQGELNDYLVEVEKHHGNLSLFLESLFRRDHFEKGHLVLRTRKCMVDKEIIQPQLDNFKTRLQSRNISIDQPRDMENEEITLVVDVGLMAQVYANLFSNAVKYTEEVDDPKFGRRKALAYGREFLPDYFGPGKDGVKFNVFTTGRHLLEGDQATLFTSGFRCRKDSALPGTGHGLAFIKNVVEIHAGRVGYEPTEQGNNFYFVLPLPPKEAELGLP
ncbi:MAG: ATP-binding protein [Deltaproteobacteria bacterium]